MASSNLVPAVSKLLRTYFRLIGGSLRTAFLSPSSENLFADFDQFETFLKAQAVDGPSIFALWIQDHLNLLALGYVSESFRHLAREFKFFADDSFGGLIVRDAVQEIGAAILPLTKMDPAERLKFLRLVIDERPSAFLAVDGGGPYREVGTGVVNLAAVTGAAVIPCAIVAKPVISLTNRRGSVTLPTPWSTVVAVVGNPIKFNRRGRREPAIEAAQLGQDLEKVRLRAKRALRR